MHPRKLQIFVQYVCFLVNGKTPVRRLLLRCEYPVQAVVPLRYRIELKRLRFGYLNNSLFQKMEENRMRPSGGVGEPSSLTRLHPVDIESWPLVVNNGTPIAVWDKR